MKENEQDATKKVGKEFKLTSLAVDNRTSILILSFILVVFGILSYTSMPKESFPEIVVPNIYVNTIYFGNSPEDIENLITRPLEQEINSITGIKNVNSTSIQDYSIILIEFNPDVEIPKALQDIKDAVDKAKADLPNDLDQDPDVREVNFSDIPMLFVNISGEYELDELKRYGEYLQDEIEKLPEVSEANLRGAKEREIQVIVDVFKMESVGVTFSDIESAIASENVTISGGNIKADEFRRSIRVVGEFDRPEDIKDVIIKSDDDNLVYVRDIAQVQDGYAERSSFARFSKLPVITLDVTKRSGENMLDAADKIKEIIAEAKASRFPDDLQVKVTNDQSRQVRSMVADLENSIISGVILVVGTLLFFMGLRNASFVGIAIPLSMFISFIILGSSGQTLNMMVLFSLILALGMLVDNGIVVVENVYRLLEEGYPIKRAVKEGVGEIAFPVIASTATTVAAFLPLVFWGGIMGQFMRFLPLTLIIVLSASLFVALVINPALLMLFAKLDDGENKISRPNLIIAGVVIVLSIPLYIGGSYFFANIFAIIGIFMLLNMFVLSPVAKWFQEKGLVFIEDVYSRFVTFSLTGYRPAFFLGGTFALLIFTFILFGNAGLKFLFFPDNEPNYINIFIEKPIGTDIETTNEFTKKVEARVIEIMQPYDFMVDAIITQVGEGTSDPNAGPAPGSSPHKARIAISFADYIDRNGVSTSRILEEVREEMKQYAGAQIAVGKDQNGPGVGPPINIEISGENYEQLVAFTEKLKATIEEENIPGIEQLKYDLESGKPELLIDIDREKARRFGLSSSAIALEIRTALFGKEVSKFKDGEDDFPIQIRLKDEQRYNLETLLNQSITFKGNGGKLKQIPIRSVADIRYSSSLGSVKRKDLKRAITIFSNVKEGYNANEIVGKIRNLVTDYPIPAGFDVRFTGEQEEQEESSQFLLTAFLLAIFMVFLIIVTQFNSISAPAVIMFSVIFSTIGVFLGLTLFKMDFVILMMGIGIISLAGIVVNNAIVLIDYTNLLRQRRKIELDLGEDDRLPYDEFLKCIAEAGKTRLRPVLLTAITTILGLIPLAVGFNINFYGLLARFEPNIYFGGENVAFWGPMAWTVIFGLTFATFLTLVIVPNMYLVSDRVEVLVMVIYHKIFGTNTKKQAQIKKEEEPSHIQKDVEEISSPEEVNV